MRLDGQSRQDKRREASGTRELSSHSDVSPRTSLCRQASIWSTCSSGSQLASRWRVGRLVASFRHFRRLTRFLSSIITRYCDRGTTCAHADPFRPPRREQRHHSRAEPGPATALCHRSPRCVRGSGSGKSVREHPSQTGNNRTREKGDINSHTLLTHGHSGSPALKIKGLVPHIILTSAQSRITPSASNPADDVASHRVAFWVADSQQWENLILTRQGKFPSAPFVAVRT